MVSLSHEVIRPADKVKYEFSGMLNYNRALILLNELGPINIPSPYSLYNLIRLDPAVQVMSARWIKGDPFTERQAPVMRNDNTYEDCINMKLFSYESNHIGVLVDVWNGDSCYGYATTHRSSYECIIKEYRAWVDHLMMQFLNLKALAAVIEEEEIERLAKVALARDRILKGL